MTASNSKAGQTVRPKSASVNTREYDEAQMHKRFADISAAIHARSEEELGFQSVDVTPRSLSLLTGNLRHFMESALGKSADPSFRKTTKFPHKLFSDYKPGGALDIMLCACLNFKALHGLRRLEFSNLDKRPLYCDLLLRIEKNLKQARLLPMVKAFFARSLPTSVQPSLRAIVSKRGATVSSASAATHIIYPDPKGATAAETDGTDYCRPLQLNDQFALVHWWYYPDSYDSWIPRNDVDGVPEPPESHRGAWHVQMRWLQDTDLFNEWMNEIDYEVPEEMRIKVIPAPRGESSPASVKEKSTKNDSDASSKKRRRTSSSSLSKQVPEPALDRVTKSDISAYPGNPNIPTLTDNSDDEAIRKPRKQVDPVRDRKGKDKGKARKDDGDGLQARKKARIGEDSRERKAGPFRSVKLRLNLKAPHERKSRVKETLSEKNEHPKSTIEKHDGVADANGMKIRVNLGKLNEMKPGHSESISKSPRKINRESGHSDVLDIKPKVELTKTSSLPTELNYATSGGAKDDSVNSDGVKLSEKISLKSAAGEARAVEDVVQESDRVSKPFSRKRRLKKERRQLEKIPGVAMVEDAVPMPEGEVPRIRNISNEGAVTASLSKVPPNTSGDEQEAGDMKAGLNGKSQKEADKVMHGNENAMEVDTSVPNGRAMAVSEMMLSGDPADTPVTGADVVEALPPVAVRIPAQSRWFRLDAIHDIEKRAMTEFFSGRKESKTPLIYKKYRDFMVDVWRQNPDKYLTATAARRHLAGDVCAILRVHAFLEHWGLINYGTEPESKPSLNSGFRAGHSRPRPMQLESKTPETATGVPRLLFFDDPRPAQRENGPVSLQKAVEAAKEKSLRERNSVLSRRELYATAAATKYECDACGRDCSKMRYHCVGNGDIELCPSCFANGEYPQTLSARDFEQLTTVLSSEAYDGTVWSEAEVLLLFEGLEKFGEDWNQVAEHVGTKSSEQCIQEFLRAPLEDSFLEDQLGNWEDGPDEGIEDNVADRLASGAHKFASPLLPFHDTANPVMMQVAFLASSVDPEVAAAAAQAALNKIMSDSGRKSASVEGDRSERAAALLRSAQQKGGQSIGTNGVGNGSAPSNGGSLGRMPGTQLDSVAVEAAAAVGLAAAVGKARHMAEAESREMERDFAVAVESKLRVVDLKLKELERLELHTRRERERLSKQRQKIFAERIDAALMRIESEVRERAVTGQSQGLNLNEPTGLHSSASPYAPGAMLSSLQGRVPFQQVQMQSQEGPVPVHHTPISVRRDVTSSAVGAIGIQPAAGHLQQGAPVMHHGPMHLPLSTLPGSRNSLIHQHTAGVPPDSTQARNDPAVIQSDSMPLRLAGASATIPGGGRTPGGQTGVQSQPSNVHPGTIRMQSDGTNNK